jgi:uncharacterized ParB-like nuclease family protein
VAHHEQGGPPVFFVQLTQLVRNVVVGPAGTPNRSDSKSLHSQTALSAPTDAKGHFGTVTNRTATREPMPENRTIALSAIVVPNRRLRALREEKVNALVESMAVPGQLQPIVVRRDNGGVCWLVAGLHRLEAAKKLKWKEINCTIFDNMDADQAELAEIDEKSNPS